MGKGMMAVVAAIAVLLGVGTWAVAQDTIQGQVVSVMIEKCGMKPGTCQGFVELRETSGRVVKMFVDPNSKLTTAGKPITIAELGIGNYVSAKGTRISAQAPWWLGREAELSN
ncbi:MAG: hypothetical protein HYY85_06695 [Deltaproteobacteria bacterium]|nr:hypothetical protein [Deltaproteobacteria bacterium]